MEENKLVDPFVITEINGIPQEPEEKWYLLLLSVYDEDDPNTLRDEWESIKGRTSARQYIIDNIKRINVKESYVLVSSSSKFNLNPETWPTVYQLFKDPRSSWNDTSIFTDGFDIDEEMDNFYDTKSDLPTNEMPDTVMPGASATNPEAVSAMMAAQGVDITTTGSRKE